MKRITWYRLLAVGALVAPVVSSAQGPQPKVRQIASIPARVDDAVLMPNGRVILYTVDSDSIHAIFAYDLGSRRSTLVSDHCNSGGLSVSPAGDRIAFDHLTGDGQGVFVATMPINPATGTAAGPAQRVSVGRNAGPNFSPDGRLVAFVSWVGAQRMLAVAPAVGGPERILSRDVAHTSPKAWSADGKWVYVEAGGASPARSVVRVSTQGGPAETMFSFSGRVASIDTSIAFYLDKGSPRNAIGRMAYVTRSGERGEFSVPPGSSRARYVSLESGSKWLLIQHPPNASGPSTTTINELDVSPILQAIRKR